MAEVEASTGEEESAELGSVTDLEVHFSEDWLAVFSEMRFNHTDMVEDTHHTADIPHMDTIHTHTRLITAPMGIGKQKNAASDSGHCVFYSS